MLKPIAIVGAGGLGREVLMLLHQINEVTPTWQMLGFYDDNPDLQGRTVNGFPCLGTIDDLNYVDSDVYLTIAIGYPHTKANIVRRLKHLQLRYATLVHPLAVPKLYQSIRLEEGALVFQGAVLTTNIVIGKHTLIYLNCTVGHDATICNFSSLMPGANIAGNTIIKERVLVGANAAVLQGLTIGAGTTVGAGAVVNKDLPANCTAVGVPVKIIKHD